MTTIPNLVCMDSTSVHQLAIDIRGKLIIAEERYALADGGDVEEAERVYLYLEEIAQGLSKVIQYMNAETETRIFKVIEKKKEVIEGKTIRQLWEEFPGRSVIADENYKKLIDFVTTSKNWDVIFYPDCPSWRYDFLTALDLWDLGPIAAMEKVVKIFEKKKKEIEEDRKRH